MSCRTVVAIEQENDNLYRMPNPEPSKKDLKEKIIYQGEAESRIEQSLLQRRILCHSKIKNFLMRSLKKGFRDVGGNRMELFLAAISANSFPQSAELEGIQTITVRCLEVRKRRKIPLMKDCCRESWNFKGFLKYINE